MVRFERGKGAKDAMKIGRKANAIEIIRVAEIHFEREVRFDRTHVNYKKYYHNLSDSDTIRVLMGIEALELNPDHFAIQIMWDDIIDAPISRGMSGYRGNFIKFREHIYLIPKECDLKEVKPFTMPSGLGGCLGR